MQGENDSSNLWPSQEAEKQRQLRLEKKKAYETLPKHSNYKRRARHHNYQAPARYMLTLKKSRLIPWLSRVEGNPKSKCGPDAPHVVLNAPGAAVEKCIYLWMKKYPQIVVEKFVIMPDHVHLCVWVREWLEVGLSRAVSNFMGLCTSNFHNDLVAEKAVPAKDPVTADGTLTPDGQVSFYEKGFNDSIAYTAEQCQRQMDYVGDNPRRCLIKRMHPDLFRRRWVVTIGDRTFMAMGNIFLLKAPEIVQVRFSRRYSPEFWSQERARYIKAIENGDVLVSPYIHPNENEMRKLAIECKGKIIRICDNGFAELFSPYRGEIDVMERGDLLLIAPMGHDNRKQEMKYAKAQGLNQIAASIAAHSHNDGMHFKPAGL